MKYLTWLLMLPPLAVMAEDEVVAVEESTTEPPSESTTESTTESATEAEPPHPVDERIREQLDALGMNYEITDRNNFSLLFTFDDGRSQEVLIRSRTYTNYDLEVRDIWSTAYQHRTKYLPEYLERRLLIENYDRIIGNWVRRDNDIIYMAKLTADASAEALKAALYEVSDFADDLEEELVGTDEL